MWSCCGIFPTISAKCVRVLRVEGSYREIWSSLRETSGEELKTPVKLAAIIRTPSGALHHYL